MILNSFDIAQNIRLVRETKGLTIEKLAELAGVSANHMSKVENGLRNLSITGIRCISGFCCRGR